MLEAALEKRHERAPVLRPVRREEDVPGRARLQAEGVLAPLEERVAGDAARTPARRPPAARPPPPRGRGRGASRSARPLPPPAARARGPPTGAEPRGAGPCAARTGPRGNRARGEGRRPGAPPTRSPPRSFSDASGSSYVPASQSAASVTSATPASHGASSGTFGAGSVPCVPGSGSARRSATTSAKSPEATAASPAARRAVRPAKRPRGLIRAPGPRGSPRRGRRRTSGGPRTPRPTSARARPRAPRRPASFRSATRAAANSSSVRAVFTGGASPPAAARSATSGDATTAAPASNASKILFGVPVPMATGAAATRAVRRNAAMSATGLATSTPSLPERARSQAGASAPPRTRRAAGASRLTRGQMSSRRRFTARTFGRYRSRPENATTGPRGPGASGPTATPFATARVPGGRCAASNGVVAKSTEAPSAARVSARARRGASASQYARRHGAGSSFAAWRAAAASAST